MSPVLWCVETLNIYKVLPGVGSVLCEDFENFQTFPVCGLCAVVCGDFEYLQSFPVCGLCAVGCVDFENFQSSPVCGSVLWCVETLKFFKVLLCVDSVL